MNAGGVICMTKLPNQVLCGPINLQYLVTMATLAQCRISVKMADVSEQHIVVDRRMNTPVAYRAQNVWGTEHVGIS